jgi:hypothetical protein
MPAPRLFVLVFLGSLSLSPCLSPPVAAQTPRSAAGLSASQAERKSVELRQGMSSEEVEKLLGKPRRTALKNGASAGAPGQGTLQWTYSWPGTGTYSTQGNLNVLFGATAPEQWRVNSWEWSGY